MKSGAAAFIPFVVIVVVLSVFGASLFSFDGDKDTFEERSNLSTYSTDSLESFVVVLDGNTGATLDGEGTYKVGSKVTVSATCDDDTEFVAWLDENGIVVSEDATYTFTTRSTKTVNLFASCITSVMTSNSSVALYSEDDWTSATWTIYQYNGDAVKKIGTSQNGKYTFPDTGKYRVVIDAVDNDGNRIGMTSEIVVGGKVFSYTWTYERNTYSVSVTIPYDDYYEAKNDKSYRYLLSNMNNALSFVTPDEACISDIAEQIRSQLDRYGVTDDVDVANIVLDLVQMSITYTEDPVQYGEDEHWAYPIETLYSLKGDCEDTTFLYSSIMESLGYDTVVCYVQYANEGGHAFVLVKLGSCDGTAYSLTQGFRTINGQYYFCETTAESDYDSWNVGTAMVGYSEIVTSYCFMTDDDKSTPTEYSIYKSRSIGF